MQKWYSTLFPSALSWVEFTFAYLNVAHHSRGQFSDSHFFFHRHIKVASVFIMSLKFPSKIKMILKRINKTIAFDDNRAARKKISSSAAKKGAHSMHVARRFIIILICTHNINIQGEWKREASSEWDIKDATYCCAIQWNYIACMCCTQLLLLLNC